jgi:PAS domain S-box-containing protein
MIKSDEDVLNAQLQQMNEILERRVMERTESMRRTAENLRALFQASPLAVIELDPNGHVLMWNPAAECLFGWKQEEILGLPDPIIPAEEQKDALFLRGRALQGESFAMLETIRQRKDGSLVSVSFSLAPLYESGGKALGVVMVIADITERKRAEAALKKAHEELGLRVRERTQQLEIANEELRGEIEECARVDTELRKKESDLRHLSAELLNAQENERKRVAQEIHDSIGGSLAAVKFRVESALQQVGNNSPQAATALKILIPIIQEAVNEARRIQMNLRPSILDDLGLLATIKWLSRQFESTYSSIRISQRIRIKEEEVPDSLKTVIFRVMQEGLNNVAKYSQAKLALVFLGETAGVIKLVIRDYGQGFDLLEAQSRKGTSQGMGLKSMKERTELSGGSFAIESAEGKGTIIRASWPLSEQS